jgi:hypothetical protein
MALTTLRFFLKGSRKDSKAHGPQDVDVKVIRHFWGSPPSLPVLDGIKAEPKRVQRTWLV